MSNAFKKAEESKDVKRVLTQMDSTAKALGLHKKWNGMPRHIAGVVLKAWNSDIDADLNLLFSNEGKKKLVTLKFEPFIDACRACGKEDLPSQWALVKVVYGSAKEGGSSSKSPAKRISKILFALLLLAVLAGGAFWFYYSGMYLNVVHSVPSSSSGVELKFGNKEDPVSETRQSAEKNRMSSEELEELAGQIPAWDGVIYGNEDAKHVVEVYTDFICEGCALFEPVLDRLQNAYSQSELKIIHRYYPTNESMSLIPGIYLEALGRLNPTVAKLFRKWVFENREDLKEKPLVPADRRLDWLNTQGLNMRLFAKVLGNKITGDKLKSDSKSIERRGLPFEGTPLVLVDGKVVFSGAKVGKGAEDKMFQMIESAF